MPEGFDPTLYGEFQAVTEAARLPPESAKQILALHERAVKAGQVAHQEAVTKLAEAARADPELSADWTENLRTANSVLTHYGASPGLLDALKTTGLGNHPELIRLLKRIGRDLQL